MSPGVAERQRRQLWNPPTPTSAMATIHCTPFTLPSNGVLQLADSVITLTTDVIFQPECTGAMSGDVFAPAHVKDPFYASTTPMTYVIAAATVIAWVLVIMLTITPRTAFVGTNAAIAPSFSTGHGIIGGANGGSTSLNGAGSRPWLQKVAALAVAISLTIATADTFEVAQRQYLEGFMDAEVMRAEVLGSTEIRVTRVISDIFLWLAQVQTLIRLFPRHKEKVLIKWIGFALILFDTVFSCLNSFLVAETAARGRHFSDAIPALSYLFELALGLLYAAWVIYYALTKRRYAFYHPKMRNIIVIALLSLVAILTPVVFFITDVYNKDIAGWGDYFRWVGAAAASVVVWEWVERIEALERDEKKDGILGREIFNGDEMLDITPSEEAVWMQTRSFTRHFRRHGRDDNNGGGNSSGALEHGFGNVAQRFRSRHLQSPAHFPLGRTHSSSQQTTDNQGRVTTPGGNVVFTGLPRPSHTQDPVLGNPTPPPLVATPVSRTDTTSAASTVYVVRDHPVVDALQPVRRRMNPSGDRLKANAQQRSAQADPEKDDALDEQQNRLRGHSRWHAMPNPFKRKRVSPPQEVQLARAAAAGSNRVPTPAHNFSRWDFKHRLGALAAETGERVRDRTAKRPEDGSLPVTVIPAQARHNDKAFDAAKAGETRTGTGVAASDFEISPVPGSGSTLTSANVAPPRQATDPPPRADDISPVNARGANTPVVIPAPSRTPRTPRAEDSSPLSRRDGTASGSGPPRADDISPVAGRRGQPVIAPAPARRSPLQASMPASDRSSPAT